MAGHLRAVRVSRTGPVQRCRYAGNTEVVPVRMWPSRRHDGLPRRSGNQYAAYLFKVVDENNSSLREEEREYECPKSWHSTNHEEGANPGRAVRAGIK